MEKVKKEHFPLHTLALLASLLAKFTIWVRIYSIHLTNSTSQYYTEQLPAEFELGGLLLYSYLVPHHICPGTIGTSRSAWAAV